MTTRGAARGEIRSLGGLRGVAACWVMLGHYHVPDPEISVVMTALLSHYYLAVDLFMILSGFVLAMTYGERLRGPRLVPGYIDFMVARIARVYPLYALTTLICVGLMWTGVQQWEIVAYRPLGIVTNLLLMQSWSWPDSSINGPGWSISLEWVANLLFAPLAVLLLHAGPRRAAAVAGLTILALAGCAFLLGPTKVEQFITGQVGWYKAPFSILRCVSEFMLGMAAWRLRAGWAGARRLGGHVATAIIFVLILPAALMTTVRVSMDVWFVLVGCALVIGLSFEESWLARGFGVAPLHWLGTVSYSVYLWQYPLLPVRNLLISAVGVLWGTQLAMLLVIGVAWVSYRWFEMPARGWVRSWVGRREGWALPKPARGRAPGPQSF